MHCASESIAVAVLAGGEGVRIGGGKPWRMLAGVPLVVRAVAAARGWSGDVVVVGRDPAQVGALDVPFLVDAPGVEGPMAGLAAALRHAKDAGHGALLAIPCDSPFLPGDLVERLRAGMTAEAGAALAASGGRLHPACALWRVRSFFRLGSYLATGRRSLRGFAEHVGYTQVAWPDAPVDPFLNINSADDLARAEALLR
ncbi:molybdenum cofactor guanylyltransferase [Sphingomonas sp. ac-8]|uniref:molybdenum cofactor guanylyltransferase n=1 Tax=Sphingomonas sp. ac-8 TaxID=3242977 RepID=UPI003A807B5A